MAWSVSEAASISGGGALRCSNANREGASAALQPSAAAPSSMASGMSFAAAVQGCVLPKICSCAPPCCRDAGNLTNLKLHFNLAQRAWKTVCIHYIQSDSRRAGKDKCMPVCDPQQGRRQRPRGPKREGGGAVRQRPMNIMPLCFAMCLVCSCALQQRRRHTDHTVLPGARCGLRGFAPGRLAGISPAVMAAVVAAHHLLDLLEQRLGRRLHAARVRLHPPHRVARRDEEGAERRPAEAAARRGLRCLDH